MIKAVLFDVDGTLVDSNDLHARAWHEAFRHFGIDLPYDRVRGQIGKGGDNLMPALLPHDLLDAKGKEIEAYRSALFRRDYLPKSRPYPGACALFARVRKDGRRVVVASSSKQSEVEHHLRVIGCRDLVDAMTSKDDVEHSKPCPDVFEAALAKVAARADEAVVVGDSPYDVQAAARAGITAVGVRTGGFTDEVLRAAGCVVIYDGLEDLLRNYDHSPLALPSGSSAG